MIFSIVLPPKARLFIFLSIVLFIILLLHLFISGGNIDSTVAQERLVPIYYVDTTEKKLLSPLTPLGVLNLRHKSWKFLESTK